MDKRNKKGQFLKGQHWREAKPYWNKGWLVNQYLSLRKPAAQIATENGCKENNILYWLNKHGIKTRSVVEVRKIKTWRLSGKQNGMYGRTGKSNPNWKGGVAPERQALYSSREWSKVVSVVWKRDKATCQMCTTKKDESDKQFHVHHIKAFALYPKLRCDADNLLLVCKPCHNKLHSKEVIPVR